MRHDIGSQLITVSDGAGIFVDDLAPLHLRDGQQREGRIVLKATARNKKSPSDRGAPSHILRTQPKTRLRRAEKAIETRNALLRAAAKVVGEHGYSEASIARITREAGLAEGTFYLYFKTRQELLEAVLPFVGEGLTSFIQAEVKGSETALDVEERSFRAAFEYLRLNPGFYRTLNEAEFSAPKGFAVQYGNAAGRYLKSLKRSKKRGELAHYSSRELEVLVYILMGIRFYLYLRFVKSAGKQGARLPRWVVEAYLKFIRKALAN